jgi:hypothetical protein
MKLAIHPGVFLSAAVVFCALWLWLVPVRAPLELVSAPRRTAEPAPASIEVDAAILERYVGHYEGRAGFTVDFSMKDGHLYAQSPQTVPFEMLATSETELYLKQSPDIQVRFRFDDRGAVTGFDAATQYGPLSLDRTR